MGAWFETSLTNEQALEPPAAHPKEFPIAVIFTSASATLAALEEADVLARGLSANITVIAAQVVPYPLPLDSPAVSMKFRESSIRQVVLQSPLPAAIRIYLCRDAATAVLNALRPASLVVIGGKRRWWATREASLARRLRNAGHIVIFKETK